MAKRTITIETIGLSAEDADTLLHRACQMVAQYGGSVVDTNTERSDAPDPDPEPVEPAAVQPGPGVYITGEGHANPDPNADSTPPQADATI